MDKYFLIGFLVLASAGCSKSVSVAPLGTRAVSLQEVSSSTPDEDEKAKETEIPKATDAANGNEISYPPAKPPVAKPLPPDVLPTPSVTTGTLTVTPALHSFGYVAEGSRRQLSLSLHNGTDSPFTKIAATLSAGAFAVSNSNCVTLAAGASCNVGVEFIPSSASSAARNEQTMLEAIVRISYVSAGQTLGASAVLRGTAVPLQLLTVNSAIDWAPPTVASLRAQNELTVGLWKGTQTEMSPITRFQIVNLNNVAVDQIRFEIPAISSISVVATTCNGLLADGAALAARGRCQVSLRKAAGSQDGSITATLRYRNAHSDSPSQSLPVRLRLLDETFNVNPVTRRVTLNGRPIDFRGIMLPFPNDERGTQCGTLDANNRCTNDTYYAQKIAYFADRGFNLFIQKIGMTREDLITVNKNSLRAIAKYNEDKAPEQRVYVMFDGQSELYKILTAAGRHNYHFPTMTPLQRALLVDNLRDWTAQFLEEPLSGYLGLFLADEPETYLEAPNYPILTEARNALRQIEKNHLTMIDLQENDTVALKNAADIVAHEYHFGDGVNRGTNYADYILDHLIPDAQGYTSGLGAASLALTHAYGNYGALCPTAPSAVEYRAIHYAWFFAGVYQTAPFQYTHAGTWKLDSPTQGSLSLFNEMIKLNREMAAIQPIFLDGTRFTLPSTYLQATVKARSAYKDGKVAIVLFNQSEEWADAPSFPMPTGWVVPAGSRARVFNEDIAGTPRTVPSVGGRFIDSVRLAPLEARVYVIDL